MPGSAGFHTTRWSVVRAAGRGEEGEARGALEVLCRTYWRPLHAYLRRAGHDNEEARELTQGFFADFLSRSHRLATLSPEGGRFRSYLLGALKHFLANARARERALKRGGGVEILPLEGEGTDGGGGIEAAGARTPEEVFERRWALALLERVLERLRGEQEAKGQGALFAALRPALGGGAPEGGYAGVAAERGMSPVAVRVAAHRLRRRYRRLLLEEVAHTVERPQDVEDEIRHLFLALDP